MAKCHGNSEDHCCYLGGSYGVCKFLEQGTVPGRRWACALRREHGNWQDVHTDERYLAEVRPKLDEITPAYNDGVMPDCGDWPSPGVDCNDCGVTG